LTESNNKGIYTSYIAFDDFQTAETSNSPRYQRSNSIDLNR
jgi:hypothetical protein